MAKEGTNDQTLLLVEEGMCEVFTEFEGNEFIIDFLPQGSIINHRAIFLQDPMAVNIRCKKYTSILRLHIS